LALFLTFIETYAVGSAPLSMTFKLGFGDRAKELFLFAPEASPVGYVLYIIFIPLAC